MNRKTREHIEDLEATLEMRDEYITKQNEVNGALKAELEELKRSAWQSTDEDVAQALRNTILTIAGNVQNSGAAGCCNIATAMAMQTRRYTTTDLMRAVEAYAAFVAAAKTEA